MVGTLVIAHYHILMSAITSSTKSTKVWSTAHILMPSKIFSTMFCKISITIPLSTAFSTIYKFILGRLFVGNNSSYESYLYFISGYRERGRNRYA